MKILKFITMAFLFVMNIVVIFAILLAVGVFDLSHAMNTFVFTLIITPYLFVVSCGLHAIDAYWKVKK